MHCDEMRELISAAADGELDDAGHGRLQAHLASCEGCREHALAIRHVSAMVGSVRAPALSAQSRARLARSLEAAEARGRGPDSQAAHVEAVPRKPAFRQLQQVWVSQAAVLLVACLLSAGSTWWLVSASDHAGEIARELVAAHVRSLLQDSPVQVASSDRHTVRPWFAGRADVSPEAVDFADRGFPLAGGRLDYVDGRRVAVLVYRHGAHVINVFAWAGTGVPALPAQSRNGYHLLGWQRGGLTYWAVSDAAPEELTMLRQLMTS